jgi:hypothetical protein
MDGAVSEQQRGDQQTQSHHDLLSGLEEIVRPRHRPGQRQASINQGPFGPSDSRVRARDAAFDRRPSPNRWRRAARQARRPDVGRGRAGVVPVQV